MDFQKAFTSILFFFQTQYLFMEKIIKSKGVLELVTSGS